ncbi:MAG TPA: hypothetical protein VGE77_14555, partial [Nocardioides sp.]
HLATAAASLMQAAAGLLAAAAAADARAGAARPDRSEGVERIDLDEDPDGPEAADEPPFGFQPGSPS